MKVHLPVTQNEYQFPATETLLSTTDTNSYITYGNAAFVRTCGFEREEMMGQPHNMIRHPDMPKEAFADMWSSLKLGQSWTALVKNRRKDGDHYWVRANAAPMRRNGQLVGYLSVRTHVSRDEINAAEDLYRRFRDGKAKGLAFYRGLVVRTGLSRWASAMQTLPAAWRVRLVLLAAMGAASGLLQSTALSGLELLWANLSLALVLWLADLFIEKQVTAPLKHILAVAQQVASGEAAAALNLNRCDEIGLMARAINQAGLNLKSLVADVHERVKNVETASREIAAANRDLSSRTEQTAANLEQTAAAMEEQATTVQRNSESAEQASRLAQEASRVAGRGGEVVNRVKSTMSDITASSQRIADIIGVMDGIAFQTNILALNAAVEAARAGEQGRGFAVVAAEVRSLAGRSSLAAKEIKTLIEASGADVVEGARLVDEASQTMGDVVAQVRRVTELVAEISGSSKEQAIGVAQVSRAVSELDQMTQQNASMVEQSGAAAESLSDQARELAAAVQVFSA